MNSVKPVSFQLAVQVASPTVQRALHAVSLPATREVVDFDPRLIFRAAALPPTFGEAARDCLGAICPYAFAHVVVLCDLIASKLRIRGKICFSSRSLVVQKE